MSVISKQFDFKGNHHSPVLKDEIRVVNYDENGNQVVSFEQPDYPSFTRSLGSCKDWTLENLMKSGINPDFPISTGNVSRIQGIESLRSINEEVEKIFNSEEK